jgi:hypothetical protein
MRALEASVFNHRIPKGELPTPFEPVNALGTRDREPKAQAHGPGSWHGPLLHPAWYRPLAVEASDGVMIGARLAPSVGRFGSISAS